MTVAYESPDGDLLCERCLGEIDDAIESGETASWHRTEYTETDPQPGEFCAVCGELFIIGEN